MKKTNPSTIGAMLTVCALLLLAPSAGAQDADERVITARDYFYLLGLRFARSGDYEMAIESFSEALQLDPNYAAAYYNRGTAYRNKGDNDSAIADFNEAIRLDSNYARAYNGRGMAYGNKGNVDRAIADYSEAIRFDPDNNHMKENLAKAREERGR